MWPWAVPELRKHQLPLYCRCPRHRSGCYQALHTEIKWQLPLYRHCWKCQRGWGQSGCYQENTKKTPAGIITLSLPERLAVAVLLPNHTHTHTHTHVWHETTGCHFIFTVTARDTGSGCSVTRYNTHTHTQPLDAIWSLLSLAETLAVAVVLSNTTHTHTQKH